MLNLSLRQRFLVAPIIGLIIVVMLTISFFLQSEKQNNLIEDISQSDVATLSLYTELFTNLSRQQQKLYELLNSAGQNIDEGTLYDKGIAIIDDVYSITQQIEEIIKSGNANNTLPKDEVTRLLSEIIDYRTSAISTVENTTVALNLAPIYLSRANQHFSILHEHFAEELDVIRGRIQSKAQRQLQETRNRTSMLGIIGILSALILIITSYISSGLLSQKIKDQINELFKLTRGNKNHQQQRLANSNEVEQLSFTIKEFKHSLITIQEQKMKLTHANRLLKTEMQITQENAKKLEEAKQQLEQRVAERTANLTTLNKELGQEIQQRVEAEDRLMVYQQIILNTDEAILVTSPNGTITEVNPAFEKVMGYSRDELIGNNPRIVQSDRHDDQFYRNIWQSIDRDGYWSGEIWNRNKNGKIVPLWVLINAIKDNNKKTQHMIALYRDISKLKQAEARLEQLAFYDPLTDLPNRTLFNEKLCQELARIKRHDEKIALLFLDLDNFKDVNDSLGHSAGDKLLIEVGQRLTGALRAIDIVSRLSGDEFNIALTELKELDSINTIARKIIDVVSAPYEINNQRIHVGVSIGISIFPDHSNHIETLRKYSDMAMYRAKDLGKNQFQMFTPDLQLNLEQQLEMENPLKDDVEQ